MGNLKSSSPTSADTEGMFEDAAYWNRYDMTTPWGGVNWNDDRTAMTQWLSPEMEALTGMQMGMYGGALAEMMSWFGMDPNSFAGLGGPPPEEERPFFDPDDPETWPEGWEYDLDKGEWIQSQEEASKSLTAESTPDEWQALFGDWGMPTWESQEGRDANWSGGVPSWFAESRHGEDSAAYAAWYAINKMDVDPSLIFGEGVTEMPQGWTSDDFTDDWQRNLQWELGTTTRRPSGRVTPDDPDDDTPDTIGDGGGWPWGTSTTGGPFGNWGGRQPEMFWAEDIPNLLWEMDWDAIPDLPTLDQFTDDRERITQEMYTQGMGLLDPYLQEQESMRRQGLANRGIPISAEIGMAEMGDFGRMRGKALGDLSFASTMGGYDEAARQFGLGLQSYGTGLQGEMSRLGLQNQARSQAWGERMGVRGQKWNELASVLGMSQINPQSMGQQGYNFNPNIDVMGGYGMEYQNNQFNSGLFNKWMSDIMGMISFV